MASPFWVKTLINKTFGQRFAVSRLSNLPVLGRLIERALFEGDDIMYLPGKRVIPVAAGLQRPEDTVVPSRVVEHFIRKATYLWRMDFCICRDSTPCRSYPRDLGCLFLGRAAMDINPRFGRPVTTEEALIHVQRCRRAGLIHLIGRNKLDTVWLQVRQGNRLLTICNCCPCCCLWRILPAVHPRIAAKVTGMPGIRVTVTARCQGCGACTAQVCFVDAIRLENQRAVIGPACRACGRCEALCPNGAIEIVETDPFAVQTAVARLSGAVDVG